MTQHKLILSVATLLLMSGLMASPVLAENATMSGVRAELRANRVALKKDNADKEIVRRTTSLAALITKINALTRLTTDQKTTLVNEVQAEIASLNSLKTEIDGDTDPTVLKDHKKTIVDNYRIYLLFLPKINIIANADKILDLVDLMKPRTTDATALAKLAEAATKAQMAIDTVVPLTPADYPANKTQLLEARTDLRVARADLNAARPLLNHPK